MTKKMLYILSLFALCIFPIGAMNTDPRHPNFALIEFVGNKQLFKQSEHITFEKAQIKAYADQLIREIPKLPKMKSIYTNNEAIKIIENSCSLFCGPGTLNPVPGYLEILKNLEQDRAINKNIQRMAGRLYELERAIALAHADYTIIEFGPKIKIKDAERNKLNKLKNTYLITDIDICAKGPDGQFIFEEVKSNKFASQQMLKELEAIITGMKILKAAYGIPCSLHTKFTAPETIIEFAQEENVTISSDDIGAMQKPDSIPQFSETKNPLVIDPKIIKIEIPNTCIVCYEEIEAEKIQFIEDIVDAYCTYIKSCMEEIKKYPTQILLVEKQYFIEALNTAQEKFKTTPGFLKSILEPMTRRIHNKKWPKLKTVFFEMIAALDAPANKKVIAFGAELFYDENYAHKKNMLANQKKNLIPPTFSIVNDCYLTRKKANTGYDLDVLLQDTEDQKQYSFIEATTGLSNIKDLSKFRRMGRALGCEVYVLHNFDGRAYRRSAFWKQPIQIKSSATNEVISLPWSIASRFQQCIQQVDQEENIYQPVTLCLDAECLYKYNDIYHKLDDLALNNKSKCSVWSSPEKTITKTPYVFTELKNNIKALFKILDNVNRKVNEDMYKLNLETGILARINKETEKDRIGGIAFAALTLMQLNCNVAPEAQMRYLPTTAQYNFDVNGALSLALDSAIKKLND